MTKAKEFLEQLDWYGQDYSTYDSSGNSPFKNYNQSGEADNYADFLASFGFGDEDEEPVELEGGATPPCPECGSTNAYYKEFHQDTDMNYVGLYCPDCGYTEEEY